MKKTDFNLVVLISSTIIGIIFFTLGALGYMDVFYSAIIYCVCLMFNWIFVIIKGLQLKRKLNSLGIKLKPTITIKIR